MCAPDASPAFSAIQPAWRPITSTSITRWCDSAVLCSRSIASVATCSAVSCPNVTSVQSMSLSMVLGTPTTGTFSSDSQCAAVNVPSPPIGISTSMPLSSRVCLIWGRPARNLSGLTRAVPSMVPPLASRRSLRSSLASWTRRSSSRPRHPSRNPTTVDPYRTSQVRTTARITASGQDSRRLR